MRVVMRIDIDVPDGMSGDYEVSTFTVSEEAAEFENLGAAIGHSSRYIDAGTYKKLTQLGEVVMSNTPAEIDDHRPLFFRVKIKKPETVLLNGLGLGVALKEILKSETIKRVWVIEKSHDVIKLVGPTYVRDPRVTIIEADAFTYKPSKGVRYGAVWHDIWNTICEDNLPEMKTLHRKYGRRCDWQGSWGRELCRERSRR
jgi:hypothetical protein